ncbi:MAG: XdhC family protein [Candidatus Aminicenantes bacterium]|jgi:xanthine dehydrogenase accessory factor
MRNIYARLLKEIAIQQPLALGTIIETSGSSPQVSGASAIFSLDGLVAGTLGGGILESHAETEAIRAIRDQESRLLPYSLEGELNQEIEAICGGEVTILLDAQAKDFLDVFKVMEAALGDRQSGVLVTGIERSSKNQVSVPASNSDLSATPMNVALSRKWIEKSNIFGQEAKEKGFPHREEVKNAFREGTPRLHKVQLVEPEDSRSDAFLYLEPHFPRAHLVVAGAGHVGKAVAHQGRLLDFEVTVIDDRAKYANTDNVPDADRVIVGDIKKVLGEFPKNPDTFIVIVTRGHSHDADALKECITSDAGYIGMIGSARKIALMRQKFLDEGWATVEKFDRVFAPIGLEIQSKTVEEIAVSIAAQLVLVRNQIQEQRRTKF